jgi:hypothetical protein
MKRENYVLLALLISFAAHSSATGLQGDPGTIYGTVTDGNGGVLPGVTVALTEQETARSRAAVTFRGDADWDQVRKLAKSGVGTDDNGYRREFIELESTDGDSR